jgi:hypothetical protein
MLSSGARFHNTLTWCGACKFPKLVIGHALPMNYVINGHKYTKKYYQVDVNYQDGKHL